MTDWTSDDPGFARVFDWGPARSVVFRGLQWPAVYVEVPEAPGHKPIFVGYHSDRLATVTGARQFLQLVTGRDLGVPSIDLTARAFSGDSKAYESALRQIKAVQRSGGR
jgi:hypothetical protein